MRNIPCCRPGSSPSSPQARPSPRNVAPRARCVRGTPDGLGASGDAQDARPGLGRSQPVFDTLSVYRLDQRSTRALGRSLQHAGLFDVGERPSENDGLPKPEFSVNWIAFGNHGRVGLDTHDRTVVERTVEAIAGYLPPRVKFLELEAGAEHVSDVPAPRRSMVAAVGALREVARAHPRDFALLLDLYVAAVAARDWRVAREALTELTHDDASEALGDEAELIDWRREALPKLRALLPAE